MKTMTRILTAAVVLVCALSLAAPVNAACLVDAPVTTIDAGPSSSFVFSPVFAAHPNFYYGPFGPTAYGYDVPPPLSANANFTFWAVGTGDPVIGLGDDNGSYEMRLATGTPGLGFEYYGYASPYAGAYGFAAAATLNGNWFNPGWDGCINTNNCGCMLISDSDGNTGFFASVASTSAATQRLSFNLGGTDGNGNNLPIKLVAIGPPSITGSVRDAVTNDIDLTLKVGMPTAGIYSAALDTGCACPPLGYVVRQQILARGSMPPSNSDSDGWSLPLLADGTAQTMTPFGVGGGDPGVVISSTCGSSDTDVYLSTQLIFEAGPAASGDFETTVVSGASLRVECGPNLADPSDRPRPTRPTRGRRDNPRRR